MNSPFFSNKIVTKETKLTLADFIKKDNDASVVKTASKQVTKEAGELPQGLKDFLDKKNGKEDKKEDKEEKSEEKSEKKEDSKDKEEKTEKKEDKEDCKEAAVVEKTETKVAETVKWVKIANLSKEHKAKFVEFWGKLWPKDFIDALTAEK